MTRGWTLLLGFALMPSVEAFQCRSMIAVAAESPIVFIGRPEQILTRREVELEGAAGSILGAPVVYDRVRFSVHEVLKGSLPNSLELLCPEDACRADDPNGPRVIALAASPGTRGPEAIVCRWTYLTPPAGWPAEPELPIQIARWRAERAEKGSDLDIWRSS